MHIPPVSLTIPSRTGGEYLRVVSFRETAYNATGGASSVAPGRISFAFGLKGAAVSVDTACSSSLVATHLGCSEVASWDAGAAVIAGVNLTLLSETTLMFQRAGMIAADGRCKTLDAAADGYVRGEGCEVALVASFHLASSTALPIALIISGTAVGQDGRSSSLTAPNGPSQRAVIRTALDRATLKPHDMGALMLHGTGTALGDPIEMGGASDLLSGARRGAEPLILGASKSCLGHGECAAGLGAAAAAADSLFGGSVLPILHLRALNAHVESLVAAGRALVPRQTAGAASAGQERAHGISSFAFQVRFGLRMPLPQHQRTPFALVLLRSA